MHGLRPPDRGRFRDLLSDLRRDYQFVRYNEAIGNILTGEFARPRMAFSFDDGFRSCLEAAAILEEFGTTGMFFVCPEIIEASADEQARICRDRLWLEPRSFMSWAEIESLKDRGHEFGSHTLSHPVVGSLSRGQLDDELGESKRRITQKLGVCEHFAWPYGRFSHFSIDAYAAAIEVGYRSSASGERGSHGAHCRISPVLPCIRRESIEARWPLRHVRYFLSKSGRAPLSPGNCWPLDWELNAVETPLKRVA